MEKVALVTGGGRRIGAAIVRHLHSLGYRVLVHCRASVGEGEALVDDLNRQRCRSALSLQGDLEVPEALGKLAREAVDAFGRVDALINNASLFYPTPIADSEDRQWQQLFACNVRAPFFLTRDLATELGRNRGNVVNICDIFSESPLRDHSIYCMSKAALLMQTRALAQELAPDVRVNAVSPGAILWPENEAEQFAEQERDAFLRGIPLGRLGSEDNIASAVGFLLGNDYVTGEVIRVDGGQSLGQ